MPGYIAERPLAVKSLLGHLLVPPRLIPCKMQFKISSLNLKGLNSPAKCHMVWKEAQRLNCDILCLQETHFASQKPPVFHHKKLPHVYQANASSKKRGVLIAVKDTVAFTLISQLSDPQGRYLILICQINNVLYSIINVYLPNVRPISSLRKIWKKVQPICQGHIVLCGDLNAIVNRQMDTSISSPSRSHRATLSNFFIRCMAMSTCHRKGFYFFFSCPQNLYPY